MAIYYAENTATLNIANLANAQSQSNAFEKSIDFTNGLQQLSKYIFHQQKATDAAAATTTAEHVLHAGSNARTITKIAFIPDAALTANDSNFGSFVIATRNADGSTGATLSTTATRITGGTGNWTAFSAIDLGGVSGGVYLTAGQLLTMAITKTGTGVVIPSGTFQIEATLT